ncbi:MAG: SDR family oxidoreductase [Gammaproteobacteria bacterium]
MHGRSIGPATRKQLEAQIPLGRLGEPSEAAHLAASLLEGRNMYQTGNFFNVSGGFSNE